MRGALVDPGVPFIIALPAPPPQLAPVDGAAGVTTATTFTAVGDAELVVVQGALDHAVLEGGHIERMAAVGAATLDKIELTPALEQQQLQVIDLEIAGVAIVQVD